MSHLISRYRQSPEIGWAHARIVDQPDPRVLAHVNEVNEWAMVALHNFSAEPVEVELDLSALAREGRPPVRDLVSLLTPGRVGLDERLVLRVVLEGYGFRRLRVCREGDDRIT